MNTLKNTLHNCKHAQQIGIEKEYKPIGFKKWLQLKIHIAYCKYCRNFLQQSKQINAFIQSINKKQIEKEKLSKEKKEAIEKEISEILLK